MNRVLFHVGPGISGSSTFLGRAWLKMKQLGQTAGSLTRPWVPFWVPCVEPQPAAIFENQVRLKQEVDLNHQLGHLSRKLGLALRKVFPQKTAGEDLNLFLPQGGCQTNKFDQKTQTKQCPSPACVLVEYLDIVGHVAPRNLLVLAGRLRPTQGNKLNLTNEKSGSSLNRRNEL